MRRIQTLAFFAPKHLFILFTWLAAAPVGLVAQNITGTLTEPSGKGQPFATVMLMRARDTFFVKGAVSDAEGRFELEKVPSAQYFVRASLFGYQVTDSKVFDFDKAPVSLGALTMPELDNRLQEVTVTAQKSLIEVKADKLVFNVDASPTNAGLNALELLRKSPGVSLDQNENISLKGRQNVMVQINGKLTPMTGQDLAQFLKGLNSNDLETIEIISNPSAKYDAEGNAGIINLRLKKDKKLGTNGSVSVGLSQGITPKGDVSITLNHRDKKFNVFGSGSMFRGRSDNSMHLDNSVNGRMFDQRNNSYWFARPNNARFGLDYSPNKRHTFGILATGGVFLPNNWSRSRTFIGQRDPDRTDSILLAENEGHLLNWNSNTNMNYKYTGAKGAELSVDADYGIFRDSQTIENRNYYRTPDETQTLQATAIRMDMPRDIDIRSLKVDFEKPLQSVKNTKFGLGGKFADVITENTFNFFDIQNERPVFNLERSNTFIYKEQIAAVYGNLNTQYKKFSLQAGLRLEHTDALGNLKAYTANARPNVDTAYWSAFPSAALSYQISKNHQLSLTVRRSIDRPRYQELNPFEFRMDELSYRKGNPFLRPQFTQSAELGWTLFQRVHLSANYAKTRNAYANISDQEYDPIKQQQRFFIQVRNLATRENMGLSLNTPIPIAKWWNGNLNVFYNYSINKADYGEGRLIDIRVGGGGFWTQQTFTLSKTLTAEVSGWYNWGGLWGAYINRPQGVMDVGMTKRLWDGKGTLRLSFTDVFHTSRWSSYTTLGALYIDAQGRWEGQQLKANFTYRFGNNSVQNARRRATAADEESKRAGDGGGGGRN